jgi:hypothetical protein
MLVIRGEKTLERSDGRKPEVNARVGFIPPSMRTRE